MAQRKVNCEVYTDRGIVGKEGADGKSAYQQAVEGGYQGTEEEFEQALASDIATVANNVTNINVVGNNIENVNTAVDNMSAIIAAPTAATQAEASASQAATSATNAQTSETNSATSASNAAESATNASVSATIATTKASEATSSATSASASANSASASATSASISAANAEIWAEGTDAQVTTLGGEHSSKGWANIAKQYVESIGAALKYKGSVSTYSDLPSTGQQNGDVWNVLDTGANYAWTGTEWDKLSETVDLSGYYTKTEVDTFVAEQETNITTVQNDLAGLGDQVSVIESKIPAEASETNQLADKNYVDSVSGGSGFGGTKRSIGEVYFSQSSLATDNSGALPLFTGETIASANTIYPDFYNWVLAHTELQCTSAEYESALSTYGECPKYVVSSGSIRLPKLSNYIKAANTSEGITQKEAGLPNITADWNSAQHIGGWSANGAVYGVKNNSQESNSYSNGMRAYFDASRSNSIYGKSSTVTPASTTLYPWVVAYAAAIPASEAQAAEFQQGLSGKADTNLGNIPSNYDYVVESQVYADGSWYRKYKRGWLEQGGLVTVSGTVGATVTLLKPFANTAYNIQLNLQTKNAVGYLPDTAQSVNIANSKTTTSFGVQTAGIRNYEINGISWRACGKGA